MSFEPFLALEASAGSGKTFMLSVRYVALVLQGNDISKILALTFTKKAANEMKERIIKTFCELETSAGELNELSKMLGLEREQIIALRDKYKANFLRSELKILTFDAFFGMILKLFSLNLGLMPDYESGANIDNEVKNRFLKNLLKYDLLSSVAYYMQATNESKTAFFATLKMLYESLDDPSYTECKMPFDVQVLAKYETLSRYALTLSKDKNYQANFSETKLAELVKKPLINDFPNKKYFSVVDAKFIELRDELIRALKEYYANLEKFKINQFFKFISFYEDSRFGTIAEKNRLDFVDVTRLVKRLLSKAIDKEMLYFRLDGRIKHILIDEFQDTNVVQYKILLPLIEETLSGDGQNGIGSFFYVGDIKQSIYFFRGGKKELFSKLKYDFKQIKFDNLKINYRSDKAIVNFVNETFKEKFGADENGNFAYKAQLPNSNSEGFVGIYEFEINGKDNKETKFDNFLQTLKQRVDFLVSSGVSFEDICILCWKNDNATLIKEFLEKAGIPVASGGSNLLINSAKVRLITEFTRFCLFGDKIYSQSINELLGHCPPKLELKIDDSLEAIFKFIAKYLRIDPFDKNLLKLYEISSNYKNLFDFIFNIDANSTPAPDAKHLGISLMSVHKSKGLQFGHVIVCDTINKGRGDDKPFLMDYDTFEDKLDIKLNDKILSTLGDESYIKLKSRIENLEKENIINELYVALTRAKQSLQILVNSNPNGNSPSFFRAYETSSKIVEYLNLQPIEIGKMDVCKKVESKTDFIPLDSFEPVPKQVVKASSDAPVSKDIDSIYFGLGLHYMLEMLARFDKPSLELSKTALINKFGGILSGEAINEICQRVLNLINNQDFQAIIKGKKLFKEQDIGFEGNIKRLDMLCINEDEMVIIDYKSSKNFILKNQEQMSEYIGILRQIYGEYKISGAIVFILKDGAEILEVMQ
ncbi:exonuclease V, helicase AddA [Campylobacter iguaniorum]|uniref:DNA 3'-5' helicase n=1 Tax=Campylobacter iguaniorum TaxID=1244531 RepID=A0A076F8G3_9BACT|nr:RecB-like helicase [Campylobacter iguaniorum]AII14311.1 exonuclease V, helicase AddA [Campylobacter iguaniorum]